ncbi:MAG: hypothetical protein N2712_06795 [Brevinematales bacterium]|nr:hypothetical protein [Brevinematales bacterium]
MAILIYISNYIHLSYLLDNRHGIWVMKNSNIITEIENYINQRTSLENLLKTTKKYRILYNENKNTFTVKIPTKFGRIEANKFQDLVVSLPPSVNFIHVTTKQNIEIQNLYIINLLDFIKKLTTFRIFPIQQSIYEFVNVSYLSGINPKGLFDVIEFSNSLVRIIENNLSYSSLHPKFRIGISDSEEDLALATVSDVGLIAKIDKGVKGFEVLIGGSLGEIPTRGKTIYKFVEYDECITKAASLVIYASKEGKVRFKNILSEKSIENIIHKLSSIEKSLKINITNSNQNDYNSIGNYHKNFTIRLPEKEINTFRVKILLQKQLDKFSIESIANNGDIDVNFAKLLSHLSLKFGDGNIIFTNRQNIIVPNIRKDKMNKVINILRIFNIRIDDDPNSYSIVSCTGTFSCNIAILNSKMLSDIISREIGNTSNLRINISGCPNSSGHHHLGDIGIFTISYRRNKIKVLCVVVFSGYGKNVKLPIGRSFALVEPHIVHKIVKNIVEMYEKSDLNSFQDFVKNNWKDIKKHIFELTLNSMKHKNTSNNLISNSLPIRKGSSIDEIFFTLFELEILLYRSKIRNIKSSFVLNAIKKITNRFVRDLPIKVELDLDGLNEQDMLEKLFEIEDIIQNNIDILVNMNLSEVKNERNSIYSW